MTTRVVFAHRSAFIRDVVRVAGASRGVVVVGETTRADELVGLCRSERPDVAVPEATFADGTPVEAVLPDLRAAGVQALVLCDDPSPERVTRIFHLGAAGCLHDDTSPEQVVDGIDVVARGGSVLGPAAAATILEQWRRLRELSAESAATAALTAREQDVLVAMAEGLGAKLIARRLGVAVKTIESHKLRIFEKLGVHTQAHAVSVAISHGLLAAAPDPSRTALVGSERP